MYQLCGLNCVTRRDVGGRDGEKSSIDMYLYYIYVHIHVYVYIYICIYTHIYI